MKKWTFWGVAFYIHAFIQYIMGHMRIEWYNMSDMFPEDNKYAFVGNDADNYIINSNFLSGYFTLASASLIVGTLFIVTGAILRAMKKREEEQSMLISKALERIEYIGENKEQEISQ